MRFFLWVNSACDLGFKKIGVCSHFSDLFVTSVGRDEKAEEDSQTFSRTFFQTPKKMRVRDGGVSFEN